MDYHGALVVDSLVPGGPAWESSTQGGLQVADVLQTVDGKNVYRCSFILNSRTQTYHAHVRVFGWVGGCVRVRVSVCVSVARRVARRSSLSNEPYSHIPSPCVHRLSVRVVRRSSMTHCSSWCWWEIQTWVKQRCSRDLWTTISAIT